LAAAGPEMGRREIDKSAFLTLAISLSYSLTISLLANENI
jgi:hypothetical protein